MENKILHFEIKGLDSGFGEKRLVFMAENEPPAGVEAQEGSPEMGATLAFVEEVSKKFDLPGFDIPKSFVEDNPFKKELVRLGTGFKSNGDMGFSSVTSAKKGELTFEYPADRNKKPIIINGLGYAALFWKGLKPQVEKHFQGKNISEELMIVAGERATPEFSRFVAIIAEGIEPTKEDVEKALKELEALRPLLDTEASKERVKMRSSVERDRQRRRLPEVAKPKLEIKLPTKVELDKEKFAERAGKVGEEWDRIKINVLRENNKINAQKWDHTNETGVKQIYQDLYDLGFKVEDHFYKTFFALLNNATNQSVNTYLSDPNYLTWFQQPAKHMKDLQGLPKLSNGFDPAEFAQAYAHMQALQGLLLTQDQSQLNTLAKQRDLDSEPAAEKVTKFFTDNYSKFTQAIRDKDYATAGMYAVGIFALYKTYKALSDKAGDKVKYLWYGLAAYTGHTFLKNAGYDLPKMAGFRDMDYEAKGTPLAAMDNIIKQSEPKLAKELKDLDYGIVVQMSETSLVGMQKLLDETNDHGIKFIHPYNFPGIFPDLADQWPFEMGIGEKGDFTGQSHTNLTSSQREYVRVGQQLYKTALGLRAVYDNTLKKDHPEYKGITYEDAIQGNATRSLGKVRHLLDAVSHYAPEKQDKLFGSTVSIDKAHGEIVGAFKDKVVGFHLERQIEKANHFEGEIMNFPVVFVLDGDKYRVYLKNNYGGVEMPGKNVAAEIPVADGPEKEAAGAKLIEAVRARMKELLRPLQGNGGRNFDTDIHYNGEWTTKVTFPEVANLGIGAEEEDATITPRKDGKGVDVVTKSGLRLSLDEEAIKQRPLEFALITKLIGQNPSTGFTGFSSLRVFSNAKRLHVENVDTNTGKFTLLVGNKRMPVKMIYVKPTGAAAGHFEFDDSPPHLNQEGLLVSNPNFADEYVDAVTSDSKFEFNETCDDLKELIKEACPQGFLKYFFKSLGGNTVRGELRGFNTDVLSGSIPNNFTNMIVNVLKTETYSKLRRKLRDAKTMADVDKITKDVLSDANMEIKALYDNISSKNTEFKREGKDWERTEFMLGVIDKIRSGEGKSSHYTLARTDLEYMLYKMNLPGWLTSSDLNENSHLAVEKMLNVFVHYTAHLDSPDLDKLTYPAQPTAGVAPENDPALRGHFVLRYLDLVKDRIINESAVMAKGSSLDPSTIHPAASSRWKIPEFETWMKSPEGRYDALDPLDNKPAFKHDLNDHKAGKHTELDEEMKTRLNAAKDRVIDVVKEDLNLIALEAYLNSVDPKEPGVFARRKKKDGTVVSELWETTNPIASVAGTKRSVQVRMMQNAANDFIDYVFSEDGRKRFFLEKPGVWERVKTYYYKVKYGI